MAFAVFADGSANLPKKMLSGIQLLPNYYTIDGEPQEYRGDVDDFDGHAYYEGLKNGKQVHTSLLNTELFIRYFEPVLAKGTDVICVVMSSGISGTFNAARIAAQELMEQFSDRFCTHSGLYGLRLRERSSGRKGGRTQQQGPECEGSGCHR